MAELIPTQGTKGQPELRPSLYWGEGDIVLGSWSLIHAKFVTVCSVMYASCTIILNIIIFPRTPKSKTAVGTIEVVCVAEGT